MTSRKLDSDSANSREQEFLSGWLLRHAAHKAPVDLAARLEEEWRADMASRPTAWSRLRFALGCCWAIQVIAYEHQPATAAATLTSGGSNALFAFSDTRGVGFYSRRGSSLAVVVALHVAVFYALLTWVTHPHAAPEPKALEPHYLPKPESPPFRPQTAPPDFKQIDRRLPVVLPEFPQVDDSGSDIPTVVIPALPPVSESFPNPVHVVKRLQGGAGVGFPNAQEFYPAKEIRLGHQGAAIVNVCVNPNGKLSAQPAVSRSSGYDGLDEAAVRLAQAGSGHYRATTEDGQAVNSCYPIVIRFQLKN